jgi:UDPglucose 6-dehydrogenase
MKIGIIGNGVVGQALAYAYREMGDVLRYDTKDERRINMVDQVNHCDIIFICVPEYVVESAISRLSKPSLIVIKSTTPVGVTQAIQQQYPRHTLIHSPEFLTERTSLHDAEHPRVNIIGLPYYGETFTSESVNQQLRQQQNGYETYYSLLQRRWPGIPIHIMSSSESETVKMFLNAFFAVKVSLFNEFHELVSSMNLNWETIISTMVTEGRMTPTHTAVPGPDGQYGFGGKCLPKDLDNLIGCMMRTECNPSILQTVQMRNHKDRTRKVITHD